MSTGGSSLGRILSLAGVTAATAIVAAIALGTPAGNGAHLSTAAPDPVSAMVVANGKPTPTSVATLRACFDKPVSAASVGAGTVSALHLYGYGGTGGGSVSSPATQAFNLGSSAPAATAAIDPGDGRCVDVQLPPQTALGGVGVDLDSYTVLSVDQGAVSDAGGRASVLGGVGLNPLGQPENTPLAGASTGPRLTGVQPFTTNELLFVFNRPLDPTPFGNPVESFAYVTTSGNVVYGEGETISGNTVRVVWPSTVANPARYEVVGGAVASQSQEVPNPPAALGGSAGPAAPSLQSAAPAHGSPSAYDLTYDQPVTVLDAGRLQAVLEDNSKVPVNGNRVSQPAPNQLRVSFAGTPVAGYVQKIVELADLGGAVQSASSHPSVIGAGAVATAPIAEGLTDGPNLTRVTINQAASTVTYAFDASDGALSQIITPASFRLIEGSGRVSAGASSATLTGANQVTAHFPTGDVANAVGGALTAPAVADYQMKANVAPLATAGTVAMTTTGTTTTTTRTMPPPPRRVAPRGLSLHVKRTVAQESTTIRFGGRLTLPGSIAGSLRAFACSGKVTVTIAHRGRAVASAKVRLGPRCRYSGSIRVRNRRLRGRRGTSATARFAGNRYLEPKRSPTIRLR